MAVATMEEATLLTLINALVSGEISIILLKNIFIIPLFVFKWPLNESNTLLLNLFPPRQHLSFHRS